jgi:predicted phosphodiesterase
MSETAKTSMTRRWFLSGAAAVGVSPFVRTWGADDRPLWTAGLMTDTHIGKTMESCSKVRSACELFAKHKVDIVVNCGDIADLYYPTGYQALRKEPAAIIQGERALDGSRTLAIAHHRGIRTLPREQTQRKEKRRLARTGLT